MTDRQLWALAALLGVVAVISNIVWIGWLRA